MKETVAVVYGGPSAEAEVSARSGRNVFEALQRRGYEAVLVELTGDIAAPLRKSGAGKAFLATHGSPGEDGTVQGLLEILGIPYTGSGVLASGLCMNKMRAKQILGLNGLPLAPDRLIERSLGSAVVDPAWIEREIAGGPGFPVVVKPNAEGSSVGVVIVQNALDWVSRVPAQLERFGCLLAERFVAGREMTVGVLERPGAPLEVLPIMELAPRNKFYDYEAKYTAGMTEFILPANLSAPMAARIREAAANAFKALGCSGAVRVDFIVGTDDFFILEVNTIPGMTATSDLPKVAEAAGIGFDDLVEIILSTARLHRC